MLKESIMSSNKLTIEEIKNLLNLGFYLRSKTWTQPDLHIRINPETQNIVSVDDGRAEIEVTDAQLTNTGCVWEIYKIGTLDFKAAINEKLIDPTNISFCMFDVLAKHVRETKPSNWKVTDKTCIDYQDKLLKLSILSSKDALHVLIMLSDNQTERFHLDTWDDVFDFVKEPVSKPHDSIIKNLFIDVLLGMVNKHIDSKRSLVNGMVS